jgi:hypothetical protein
MLFKEVKDSRIIWLDVLSSTSLCVLNCFSNVHQFHSTGIQYRVLLKKLSNNNFSPACKDCSLIFVVILNQLGSRLSKGTFHESAYCLI